MIFQFKLISSRKNALRLLAYSFILLLSQSASSQTKGGLFTENEIPLERELEFLNQRKFADGTLPELWEKFVQSRTQNLLKSTIVPLANWQSLGPDGLDSLTGTISCHAFNPANPQIMLVGSIAGGLWKTYNGGDSWQVLTDDLPSLRISAVAIDPSDTNHIIIGTGFYYNSSTTLPGIGLLESFDGGSIWTPNTFTYPYVSSVAVSRIIWDKRNPMNVYLAASNGLWVSRDNGKSWTLKMTGLFSDLDIIHKSPNILYACKHSTGIYKSIDSAETWIPLTGSLPTTSLHRITFTACDSFPDFMLCSIVDPVNYSLKGLYKSSNAGSSWTAMSGVPAYLCVSTVCQGWYVNQLGISPVDTNIILLGGHQFWVTSNGGKTWIHKDYYTTPPTGPHDGVTYVDQFDFGFDPISPSTVYAFNDGGIFKSINNGAYWQKKNKGLITALVYQISSCASDTTKIISASQDLGLHYLDNSSGNLNWKIWLAGDGTEVAYDPNNSNVVYGDAPYGTHKKNNNVGSGSISTVNFNSGIVGTNSIALHFVLTHHPTLSNVLYTANDSRIFKTTNATTWTTAATIPSIKSIEISKHTPTTIYAGSFMYSNISVYNFYISIDDGKTWNPTASSPGWRVTDIESDPNKYGTVFATRNSAFPGDPHVYKSTDNGNTWTPIATGLPDVSTNAITVNPYNSNIIYTATDLGIYISEDAGLSWNEYNDNIPPYYITDMHYHKLDSTLRIATMGRGVWKTKSIYTNVVDIKENKNDKFNHVKIFPNPANANVAISIEEEINEAIEVRILNSMGQEVKNIFKGKKSQQKYSFKWDGTNEVNAKVAIGTYFISVRIGDYKKSYKLIYTN